MFVKCLTLYSPINQCQEGRIETHQNLGVVSRVHPVENVEFGFRSHLRSDQNQRLNLWKWTRICQYRIIILTWFIWVWYKGINLGHLTRIEFNIFVLVKHDWLTDFNSISRIIYIYWLGNHFHFYMLIFKYLCSCFLGVQSNMNIFSVFDPHIEP